MLDFCFLLVGRHYLEKYCHDKNDLRIRTQLMKPEHVQNFENAEVTIPKWIGRVKNYVMQVVPELVADKRMVFMMETQIFFTYTTPSRQLCVVVCVKYS